MKYYEINRYEMEDKNVIRNIKIMSSVFKYADETQDKELMQDYHKMLKEFSNKIRKQLISNNVLNFCITKDKTKAVIIEFDYLSDDNGFYNSGFEEEKGFYIEVLDSE